jgi:Flp pilus assembly protein protease CpaA
MRMAILGAALSVIVVVLRNYVPLLVGARLGSHLATIRLAVPYGVAIAGAGIMTILLQPLLFGYAISLPSFL